MDIALFLMVLSSGLFAGGTLTLAWNRLPIWKTMPHKTFKNDFKQTIEIADRLQPLLLVVAIITATMFISNHEGTARTLAYIALAGYSMTLMASLAILVPLQRRILATSEDSYNIDAMRQRWLAGHMGRTILSIVSFLFTASAISM